MAEFKKATILEDDFKTSHYMDVCNCPIAQALKRAGMRDVIVGGYSYRYNTGKKSFHVEITPKLREFVLGWHRKRAIPAHSFTFRIPVA
jgi:hypothetical protein